MKNLKEHYSVMFTSYPDVVNIVQMREMLGGIGISTNKRLDFNLIKWYYINQYQ